MITDATISIDKDIFDAIEDTARKSPGLMNTAYKREVGRIRRDALAKLHQMPGSPKYPIRWTSERQRKFVMAKLRRMGNVPYQRTGALVDAWQVEHVEDTDGGLLRIYNPSPIEQYVTGSNQQGFHRDTGWYYSQDILADIMVDAEDRLIETWFTVADPFAGVSG